MTSKSTAVNVTVVIGECDALDLFCPALVNPGLQQLDGVRAHVVRLEDGCGNRRWET